MAENQPPCDFSIVFEAIEVLNTSISDLVLALLTETRFKTSIHTVNLLVRSGEVVSAVLGHTRVPKQALEAAEKALHQVYAHEICDLTKASSGYQFSAHTVIPEDLQDFNIQDLCRDLCQKAPFLSLLFDAIFSARTKKNIEHSAHTAFGNDSDYDIEADALEGSIRTLPSPKNHLKKKQEVKAEILRIKKTAAISIMMHSINQKANIYQSIFGIFLHSCHTPEQVIEALAHIGITISKTAILSAVKSLSNNLRQEMQGLGHSMIASYAFDNFDVNMKSSVPVIQKMDESMKHFTTGLIFRLEHGVTREHLRCSRLWDQSKFNPKNNENEQARKTYEDLLSLFPDPIDKYSMTSRDHFNSYMFLRDLLTYGPPYFAILLNQLELPKPMEAIPVIETCCDMQWASSTMRQMRRSVGKDIFKAAS